MHNHLPLVMQLCTILYIFINFLDMSWYNLHSLFTQTHITHAIPTLCPAPYRVPL